MCVCGGGVPERPAGGSRQKHSADLLDLSKDLHREVGNAGNQHPSQGKSQMGRHSTLPASNLPEAFQGPCCGLLIIVQLAFLLHLVTV